MPHKGLNMAKENISRIRPSEQPPEIRAKNFSEVSSGFNETAALAEASRCLGCKNAPCKTGCPVGVPIPEFIAEIKAGRYASAGEIIKMTNSLPSVCGRVCPQELQCEKNCILNKLGREPIAVGTLERFAGDAAIKETAAKETAPKKSKLKAAIIGSGPAGLSCAADLAKAGFSVTVFEAFHEAGGVLVYGIPEFRLPKSIVREEIKSLKELGVEIKTNMVIGKTFSLKELTSVYDAVFVGTGAGLPMFLNIPGENLPGVYSANEYLTRVNLMKAYKQNSETPVIRGRNVVVVGAGNVAMDAARTALRMGADKVTVVYRRSRAEMPARKEEILHAEEEGIVFKLLTDPISVIGKDYTEGIRVRRMKLGEPDAKGRPRPVPIEGSEYDIECDMLIVAIGTSPNPLLNKSEPSLTVSPRGTIVTDENGKTSLPKVYAGGDAVIGAATVILAMSAGRRAAKAIIEENKDKLDINVD